MHINTIGGASILEVASFDGVINTVHSTGTRLSHGCLLIPLKARIVFIHSSKSTHLASQLV